jgi:hypothetical protein
MAVEAEDYARAERVAQEFADDLRLILDDLGWGTLGGESLELTTPPDILRRVCTRLQNRAESAAGDRGRGARPESAARRTDPAGARDLPARAG